jgi:hypothetical protein
VDRGVAGAVWTGAGAEGGAQDRAGHLLAELLLDAADGLLGVVGGGSKPRGPVSVGRQAAGDGLVSQLADQRIPQRVQPGRCAGADEPDRPAGGQQRLQPLQDVRVARDREHVLHGGHVASLPVSGHQSTELVTTGEQLQDGQPARKASQAPV